GGDHAAAYGGAAGSFEVEAVRGPGGGVEAYSEGVSVEAELVADPASVVVGEFGAIGGEHDAGGGVPAEVPEGPPAGGPLRFTVPRRASNHDLHPLPRGDPPEHVVDHVEVRGLLLPALGEYGREGTRGPVHGHLPFHPSETQSHVGAGCLGDSAPFGYG